MRKISFLLNIFCIMVALLITLSPASAFFFKKKKKATKLAPKASEHINIQKKYHSNKHHYDLDLEIKIPEDKDYLVIEQFYNELSGIELKDIRIDRIKKRKQRESIKAYKTEKRINETANDNLNPELVYDLVTSDKNRIIKSFYYKKSDVFKSSEKEDLNLNLIWQTNAKVTVKITEDQLYASKAGTLAQKEPEKSTEKKQPELPKKSSQKKMQEERPGVAGTGFTQDQILMQQEIYQKELMEAEEGFAMTQEALQGDQYNMSPQMMQQQMMMQMMMQGNPAYQNPMYSNPMMIQNPALMNPMIMQQMNPMMMQNPALFQQMMQNTNGGQ